MGNKPNWGAALRTLGHGLEDIDAHKREEQLMKLVREQRVADMEAERAAQEQTWQAHRAQAQQEQEAALQSQRDFQYPVVNNPEAYGLNVDPSMAVGPNGPEPLRLSRDALDAALLQASKPERVVRDPVADFKAEWDYRGLHPHASDGGAGGAKTPDMAGLYAAVKGFDPNLSAAYENAGLLDDVNAAAVRAAQSGLQPEAAVPQAYQQFSADPALMSELSGSLPSGMSVGGVVPGEKRWSILPDKEPQFLEKYLAASEEARQKVRAIGAKTKTITAEKVDAIIANVAAKWKLDADGQNALREQVYLGRAAENMAPPPLGETPEQRQVRLLTQGGGS